MAVESAADRAAFFDPDEFGSTAAWSTAAGVTRGAVDGILTRPHAEAGIVDAFRGVSTQGPILFACRAADVAGIATGDVLTIATEAFTVRDIQPDGTGLVRLVLDEV